MSDLAYYRDRSVPLADRIHAAGIDNLTSNELDGLLQEFASEVRDCARRARGLARSFVAADKDDEFGFTAEIAQARSLAKSLASPRPMKRDQR